MNYAKFNTGTVLIIHDRWIPEWNKLRAEGIYPEWGIPFPFGTTDPFLPRHIGCLIRIVEAKRLSSENFEYRLEFYCDEFRNLKQEYANLPADLLAEIDEIWLSKENLIKICDKINPNNIEDLLYVR